MDIVCFYCKNLLRTIESNISGVSHGVCRNCLPKLLKELGQSLSEFLDELSAPILVLQEGTRIVAANAAARKLSPEPLEELCGRLCGDVIGCRHSKEAGGCGQTVHCLSCTIRRSVAHTIETGRVLQGYPGISGHRPDGRRQEGSLPDLDGEKRRLRTVEDRSARRDPFASLPAGLIGGTAVTERKRQVRFRPAFFRFILHCPKWEIRYSAHTRFLRQICDTNRRSIIIRRPIIAVRFSIMTMAIPVFAFFASFVFLTAMILAVTCLMLR